MGLYRRFKVEEFTLRDYLALERTILSNERTLLAYVRTGLALSGAGLTGYFYFDEVTLRIGSLASIFAGVVTTTIGVVRFRQIKRRLDTASPDETANLAAEHASSAGVDKGE